MTDREDELTLAVVAERMKSLRDISEVNFIRVLERLDKLDDLPLRVETLYGITTAHAQRLDDLESTGTRGVEFRRGTLPIVVLTFIIAMAGIGAILTQAVHG